MQKRATIQRRRCGYVLITILVIGLAAALAILAVVDLALSAYQSEARRRYSLELRNAAEAGVDYAIGQLNTAAAAHQPSSIDDGNQHDLPTGYLLASGGTPTTSNQNSLTNLTVKITVAQISPSSIWADLASWSSVYSPNTDFTKSTSTIWKSPPTSNLKVDGWRVLTVKAQYLSFSRSIRVVLQPRYDPPPQSRPSVGNQSYFQNVLLGNQALNFAPAGGLTVQAVASTGSGAATTPVLPSANAATASQPAINQVFQYPLTLTTNSQANVGPNTDIKGNVQISSVNSGANSTALMNPGSQGGIIEGTLTGNSNQTNVASGVLTNNGSSINSSNNVYADADLYNVGTPTNPGTNPNGNPSQPLGTNRVGTNNTTPVTNSAGLSQVLPAPALSEPGSSLPRGTTWGTGDYSVSALDTSSEAQFPSNVTVNGNVRLFVQDGNVTSNGSAMNIDTTTLSTASSNATSFQIWYSGANPININLSNGNAFNGTIYAPNATVTTTGSGTFTGAIVANVAQINHSGALNLRTDLTSASGAGAGLSYNSSATTGSLLNGYKPVTWEEPQL